jgi:hypothetical protein
MILEHDQQEMNFNVASNTEIRLLLASSNTEIRHWKLTQSWLGFGLTRFDGPQPSLMDQNGPNLLE